MLKILVEEPHDKYCVKCSTNKHKSEFNKCTLRADGLQTQCRICKHTYRRQYVESEHGKLKAKQYHEANKLSRNEQSRAHYVINADKLNVNSREYYRTHCDNWKQTNKKWYDNNTQYYRAKDALRGARKRAVNEIDTPEKLWVLREAYSLAKLRSNITGIKWEVDHINPISLGGKHALENIQVVSMVWNRRKGNKHANKFIGA